MKIARLFCGLCAACIVPVATGASFLLTLDTSLLVGHPAEPFFIEFQLNDGVGSGDGNNVARIFDFDFGGGFAEPVVSTTGGVTGDAFDFAGVRITDTSFFNQFYQQFTPGNTLSFFVNLTENVDPGPQPDEFSFAILDCVQAEIPTTSPANAFFSVDIDPPLTVRTFSGNPNGNVGCISGPGIPLPAPTITVVPEPSMFAVFAGLLVLPCWAARRRRSIRD